MGHALRKSPANDIDVGRFSHHQWRILIADGIRDKLKKGVKIRKIAEDTGLCSQTISRLIYGETKFPRFNTMIIILVYLGYQLYAEKS